MLSDTHHAMDVYFPRLARRAADPSAGASEPVGFRLRGLEADSAAGTTVSASISIASLLCRRVPR